MTRRGACFVDPYPAHLLGVIARWLNKKAESPQFFAPLLAQLRKSFYLCTAIENESFSDWALSSAGSERLPYKQRVGGSNPSAPTYFQTAIHRKMGSCFFVCERNARGWGECTQVRRSAVCITGVGRFFRRVFLRRGSGWMQFFARAFAQSPKVLGVTSSRNRSMGGVVFGKRRREKEKRWEMLSISPQLFIRLFAQPRTPPFD